MFVGTGEVVRHVVEEAELDEIFLARLQVCVRQGVIEIAGIVGCGVLVVGAVQDEQRRRSLVCGHGGGVRSQVGAMRGRAGVVVPWVGAAGQALGERHGGGRTAYRVDQHGSLDGHLRSDQGGRDDYATGRKAQQCQVISLRAGPLSDLGDDGGQFVGGLVDDRDEQLRR